MAWLSVWSEVQTCIWPSWCHCHSLSLASVKFRLVLPFWYRLTRVVPEKGPLNRCVCVQYVNKKLKVLNQNVTSWSPISDPNYHNHSNIDTRTAELPAIFQLAHSKCQQLDDKKPKQAWPKSHDLLGQFLVPSHIPGMALWTGDKPITLSDPNDSKIPIILRLGFFKHLKLGIPIDTDTPESVLSALWS